MADTNEKLAHSIGELSGQLKIMHQSITDSINVMRQDLRRMEDANRDNLKQLEQRLDAKHDALDERVIALENQDKKIIKDVAKISAGSGSLAGALAAGFTEIIKHIF